METIEFEKLVKKAMLALPIHIREKMDNVAIIIEKRPTGRELEKTGIKLRGVLLGLYQGIPKTKRGMGYSWVLPDKITIFQESIEGLAHSDKEIMELVRLTVWHEIAHHFGFSEERVRSLETKWRNPINGSRNTQKF